MGVCVQSDAHSGMAQALRDDLGMNPLAKHKRGMGMPQVVEFEILYPCLPEGCGEGTLDILKGFSLVIGEYVEIIEPSGNPLEGPP